MTKNETKPLSRFWVFDIESFKWTHFVTMGLTDGQSFYEFAVTANQYKGVLRFKPLCPHQSKELGPCSGPSCTPYRPWWRRWPDPDPELERKAIKEAMDRFFELLISDGENKKIYAHFGGKFDFLFLLNYLLFNPDWTVSSMIPRGSGILCFDAEIVTGNGEKVKLSFHDSSAMMPFGLKSLTQNFKVESLKTDWNHQYTTPFTTAPLIYYCKHDCLGLHQVIEKYHTWPIIKRAGSASTIAGQAMRVLRTMMTEEVWSLNPRVDAFVRQAYFGGRTEIFKPLFTGPGTLKCADVNSLYPTVMREPPKVGEIPQSYPIKFKKYTYEYDPTAMGFFPAEVRVPDDMYVPPLGVAWNVDGHKKFIFPTGTFQGVWSTLDLEYARSLGVEILWTGKGAIFESGENYFKKYVDELYRIRETSERESVSNVLAKLLLNSCYGRFGLRTERENLEIDEGQLGLKEGIAQEGFILEQEGKQIRLMPSPKTLETFNNVAVSAWVTSASRVFMHRYYMKLLETLYYTDTDSLFTTEHFEDQKGLGGLKLEYECQSACFLLPKTYIVDGIPKKGKKITMKGFDRKKTKDFTVEDFMTALEGDLKRLAVTQEPKFATFKSALSRGKILTMLPESGRRIQSMYDKRIIYKTQNGSYDTRPHKIIDNQPIVTKK